MIRYLAYALGEIVLVVIGILIAIQLNARKQASDTQKVVKYQLEQVLIDLSADQERFDQLYAHYERRAYSIQQLVLAQRGEKSYTNDSLGRFFLETLDFRRFTRYSSSYESMASAGNLHEVRDNNLVDDLINYHSRMYLTWSTEDYADIVNKTDFNRSIHFSGYDRQMQSGYYRNIPGFELTNRVRLDSDFQQMLDEPWAGHYLLECLNQLTFIFNNLAIEKANNRSLTERISAYAEGIRD